MSDPANAGDWDPEIVDRAGEVIRQQTASMIEAAEGSVARLEREAGDRAARERSAARAQYDAVVSALVAVERELNGVRRDVAKEGDRLRSSLVRLGGAPSAPGDPSSSPTGQGRLGLASGEAQDELSDELEHGEAGLREAVAEDDWDRQPPETEVATDTDDPSSEPDRPEAGSDEVALAEGVGAESEPDVPAAGTEEVALAEGAAQEWEPDLESAPSDALRRDEGDSSEAVGEAELLAKARQRLKAKSDIELGEIHALATSEREDGPDVEYWRTLADAAIEEAAARTGFGESLVFDSTSNRRERKRQQRAVETLGSVVRDRSATGPPK